MDFSDPLLTQKLLFVIGGSFFVCALVILTQRWHGHFSLDHDLSGAQKLHHVPVPRVGGIGLLAGLLVAVATGYVTGGTTYPTTLTLLACAMPVFLAGFVEDLTKGVSVRVRLLASFVSASLAIWLLGTRLTEVDTPIIDLLLQYPAVSILFTVFAVGGVTQSINIIDGLNGLAAGTVSIMLGGLAALAWMQGDVLVMKLCLWGIAALLGFMLLNFPLGKIFLGDGGAYLAGFWLAECAVLLLSRNKNVSTWAVLLCCLYPVWETVYSIYRRNVIHKAPSGSPDQGHMHQLLFKWVSGLTPNSALPHWLSHGLTSVKIWSIVVACQLVAVSAPSRSSVQITAIAMTSALYVVLHRALFNDAVAPAPTDVAAATVR